MFKYEKLLESLVNIVIAIITVDFFAWILHEEPSRIVGWIALGIAAGATTRD
jgi:hypothetical protein